MTEYPIILVDSKVETVNAKNVQKGSYIHLLSMMCRFNADIMPSNFMHGILFSHAIIMSNHSH